MPWLQGNHEFDFGLDEAKKYKEILKSPLLKFEISMSDGAFVSLRSFLLLLTK